ncbi:MAG: AAA family ATPase [Armatimonadetes bacterium]|nr:AAA family ATPase [Armatimonadota bacterium]NDK12707.1 AAA family ATPase [Armatimonadota bacterium]
MTVKGFRSLQCLEEVEFRPRNVLIGPNGSGKSNSMEVLAFLHALRQGRLVHHVDRHGGADSILHFGSKQTEEIELKISFRAGRNGYRVRLSPTARKPSACARQTAAARSRSRLGLTRVLLCRSVHATREHWRFLPRKRDEFQVAH